MSFLTGTWSPAGYIRLSSPWPTFRSLPWLPSWDIWEWYAACRHRMLRFCSPCRTSWWAERIHGPVPSYDCRTSVFRCANSLYIYCRDPDRKSAWAGWLNLYDISFREHSPCCKSTGRNWYTWMFPSLKAYNDNGSSYKRRNGVRSGGDR